MNVPPSKKNWPIKGFVLWPGPWNINYDSDTQKKGLACKTTSTITRLGLTLVAGEVASSKTFAPEQVFLPPSMTLR